MRKPHFLLALLTLGTLMTLSVQAQPPAGAPKMTSADALKQAPKLSKKLAPLEKAMNEAEAKMKKNPKDAKLKKAYVEATYKYGHEAMMDAELPPRIKYRAALALFRKALATDPKHKPSLDERKTIEDIYKQMGMPVPE
jgi:tetratricopeptide (TPR) repeat protein